MGRHFALTVHLYDQRYHGAGEWPPAPARVYQALVAGAAQGRHVPDDARRALVALEQLPPPVIAAPVTRRGQRLAMFVPNNDLDAFGGDPDHVDKVRTKKAVHPHLLESDAPFLYAWPLPEGVDDDLTSLADGLFQLGRGVDPAWAIGETLDDEQLAARLRAHRGSIHRPTPGDGSVELACPTTRTLVSLLRRFEATLVRIRPSADGGPMQFVQPPKAQFSMVRYDGTPTFHLFELRSERQPAKLSPWPAWRATALIEHIRNVAATTLKLALPECANDIERVLVGRKRDGADAGPTEERIRFVPLPSIGHEHVDRSIRRVLVQVPPGPLVEGDVLWALAGRLLFDTTTGEVHDTVLAAAPADEMVRRYRAASRAWRSVTPLALVSAKRRRIAPERRHEEAKPAAECADEQRTAQHAIGQALRHAGIEASLVRAHVQREPFDARGTRAERFADGTRFPKEALWHVELELDRTISGPIVLGDGRFLGLGVMAPKIDRGAFALAVESGLREGADPTTLARALRRAVMARAQAVLGARNESGLPAYFHGHGPDGTPLRDDRSSHVAYAVDLPRSRFLVVPPHVLDGRDRPYREHAAHLETLERALEGLTVLRAGREGLLEVQRAPLSPADPLLRSARTFRSVTDYVVTRHAKCSSAEGAVIYDVRRECKRRKLPTPEIRVANVRGASGAGVLARVELEFAVAIRGPLLLGRTRYLGGGLFAPL